MLYEVITGHGKSTLLHLIGGLDRPTSGSVRIDGEDMFSLDGKRLAALRSCKIGFVFQFFNLLQNLTAVENVETALMLAGAPESKHRITSYNVCYTKLLRVLAFSR